MHKIERLSDEKLAALAEQIRAEMKKRASKIARAGARAGVHVDLWEIGSGDSHSHGNLMVDFVVEETRIRLTTAIGNHQIDGFGTVDGTDEWCCWTRKATGFAALPEEIRGELLDLVSEVLAERECQAEDIDFQTALLKQPKLVAKIRGLK